MNSAIAGLLVVGRSFAGYFAGYFAGDLPSSARLESLAHSLQLKREPGAYRETVKHQLATLKQHIPRRRIALERRAWARSLSQALAKDCRTSVALGAQAGRQQGTARRPGSAFGGHRQESYRQIAGPATNNTLQYVAIRTQQDRPVKEFLFLSSLTSDLFWFVFLKFSLRQTADFKPASVFTKRSCL